MTTDQSSSPMFSQTLSVESLENIKKEVLRCGRIIFPDKNEVSPTYDLPTFLSLFPPTKIVFPGCAWIQVHNPNRKRRIDDTDDDGGNVDKKQDEDNVDNNNEDQVQQEKDKGESSHDVLVEFANFGQQRISAATKQKYRERLLASANDTYGKWMIFTDSQQVEAVWNAIATKVFHGELGCSAKVNNKKPAVRHSKTVTVSGEEDVNGNGSGQHSKKKWYERKNDDDDDDEEEDDTYVICVYVDNFRNKEDVRRVLRVLLRTEGVTINAGFKPDFVTYLGLYSDKRMNPSCYHNAHKLGMTTIYKEMLKEEKEILKKDLEDEKGEKDGVHQKHHDEIIELDNTD